MFNHLKNINVVFINLRVCIMYYGLVMKTVFEQIFKFDANSFIVSFKKSLLIKCLWMLPMLAH